ncbi:MAG: hypothetical protein JXB39_09440 [Deltaproteobacteria bacterium]|nr:hypothetical protein [Deltaproteobacteria bacterium]
MTRPGSVRHPRFSGRGVLGPGALPGVWAGRWRRGALGVLVVAIPLLVAARGPRLPRRVSAEEAVERALEIVLLADPGWEDQPGALEEARRLAREPDAEPGVLPERLEAAALAWSGRSLDAHRRYAAEIARRAGRSRDGSDTLEALDRVRSCVAALEAARTVAPIEAEATFAACAGSASAVQALQTAGVALDAARPATQLGRARIVQWRDRLASARVPGPACWGDLPAGDGFAPACPLCGVVRIEDDSVLYAVRPLVSWVEGRLVTDPGPAPERVNGWSEEAFARLSTIAARRQALSFGGVEAGGARPEPTPPRIAIPPHLALSRLAAVAGWMDAGRVAPCLLVDGRVPGELCLQRPLDPEEAGDVSVLWVLAAPGTTVADLVRLAEDVLPGGGRVGLVDPGASDGASPDVPE